jgi:catechol 2,3-dioxygenase-like lactoylglutathione lyase family enzyme
MKIIIASIFVINQEKALKFYTEKLGFVKKHDVPAGEFRWLTVVSPNDKDGTELLLEPNDNSIAKTYQHGLFEQGIPATSFGVEDIEAEHERLKDDGVRFTVKPKKMNEGILAVFDDTCGNLIQIMQELG